MEDIVYDLTFQCDMYLQEVYKAYISLTKIGDALSDYNLFGSLVD